MRDLPIHSDSTFRSGRPFPALDAIGPGDVEGCLDRFDRLLDHGEDARNAAAALRGVREFSKKGLVGLHGVLFEGRPGAGRLRTATHPAVFPGQDCPEPRFVEPALDNFEKWLGVESVAELHPIERAALALTRLIDIWPFDFGNRTASVVFANAYLLKAGYPPFFVLPEQLEEFDEILSRAIAMQTEPLVRAIYRCMVRELDRVRS